MERRTLLCLVPVIIAAGAALVASPAMGGPPRVRVVEQAASPRVLDVAARRQLVLRSVGHQGIVRFDLALPGPPTSSLERVDPWSGDVDSTASLALADDEIPSARGVERLDPWSGGELTSTETSAGEAALDEVDPWAR